MTETLRIGARAVWIDPPIRPGIRRLVSRHGDRNPSGIVLAHPVHIVQLVSRHCEQSFDVHVNPVDENVPRIVREISSFF